MDTANPFVSIRAWKIGLFLEVPSVLLSPVYFFVIALIFQNLWTNWRASPNLAHINNTQPLFYLPGIEPT